MTMAGFLTKSTKGTSFRLLRKFSGDFFPFVFFVYGLRGLILSHSTREQLSSILSSSRLKTHGLWPYGILQSSSAYGLATQKNLCSSLTSSNITKPGLT